MIVIAYDPKSKKVQCTGATMPADLEAFDSCHYEQDKEYPGGRFVFTKPGKRTCYEEFKKYEVSADSIEDFHDKYHKASKYSERGPEYVQCVLESSAEDIEKYGYTIITHHDSKTGETVSYYGN